jgi:methylenetetrahydrofolate dehydrogenase (NADP+) / methenyltetrahydrofolate cyclohydrolase
LSVAADIIDGKAFAAGLRARVAERVAALVAAGHRAPGLAVVLVGEDPASAVYVRNKGKATRDAGMVSVEHRLPADVPQQALLDLVDALNADPAIDGILVQLPLPGHINERAVPRGSTRTRMSTASTRSMPAGSRPGCRVSCRARRSAA